MISKHWLISQPSIRFLFCLFYKHRPKAPPAASPALRPTPRVEKVQQSLTGTRTTIAMILTSRMSNENSLESRVGIYRSSRKNHVHLGYYGHYLPIQIFMIPSSFPVTDRGQFLTHPTTCNPINVSYNPISYMFVIRISWLKHRRIKWEVSGPI